VFIISLIFLTLDPLVNGLRRRAQSLNFSIRSNQPSVDNTRQNTSISPSAKRRRKEAANNLSLSQSKKIFFCLNSKELLIII